MKKKGFTLAFVAVGVVVVAAVVPWLVTDAETNRAVSQSFDESNKIIWAAESAASNAYKKQIATKEIKLVDMSLTKEKVGGPSFVYGNFTAKTSLDIQKSLYGEYCKWKAHGSAANYDFGNQINAVYVKPGVEFGNNGTYVWDKYGRLFKKEDGKLKRDTSIKKAVWQLNNDIALDVDGKAWKLTTGKDSDIKNFLDPDLVGATKETKKYYAMSSGNIINDSGEKLEYVRKDPETDKEIFSDISNVVFVTGGNKHILAIDKNGNLYGCGDNSKGQITNKENEKFYSDKNAVLIAVRGNIPGVTSNSFVDLTPYKDKANPIKEYLESRYGVHPHHCSKHGTYDENCNLCKERDENPWGGDKLENNCDCQLCSEIRDVSNYDGRSKHLDKCHCDDCQKKCERGKNSVLCNCDVCKTKRQHFWSCQCNDCSREKASFWGTNSEMPNPSTPLHVEEDTEITNFETIVDANSAYFSVENFFGPREKDFEYRSVVEFKVKFIPKNPADPNKEGDLGSLKYYSNDAENIYVIDGGKVYSDQKDFYDPLKKTWLVTFPPVLKKNNSSVDKLPKGDYEIFFESSCHIEKRRRLFNLGNQKWIAVNILSSRQVDPFNMFWGVDKNNTTHNNTYLGSIFRINDNLFNLTSGNIVLNENHRVKMAAAGDTFSVILAEMLTKDNKGNDKPTGIYKVINWGDDKNMAEVIFPGDGDKQTGDYAAKHIVSLKAGKTQVVSLTDRGKIYTWKANDDTNKPKEVNIDNLDGSVVAIAAGDKNMLITDKGSVYEWNEGANGVYNSNKLDYD